MLPQRTSVGETSPCSRLIRVTLRILFLHEVGYFEKPIFEMHEFPEYLSSRGHEVCFVDFLETKHRGEVRGEGGKVQGRVLRDVTFQHYSQVEPGRGIVSRLIAAVKFPFFFRPILDDFKPDLIVGYSVPTSGWQALVMARRRSIPFVFRALDVSHKIRRTFMAPLIWIAERYIYQRATWVSANNESLLNYCRALGRSKFGSVELPPLDSAHFSHNPRGRKSVRENLGIPQSANVITYMGSFFYFSGLPEVISYISSLPIKPFVILIGGGEQSQLLREMVIAENLQDFIKFTGFVSFDELPDYLSAADIGVNPMVPGPVSNLALPNKVLQYMATGLIVVTTNLEGLARTLVPSSSLHYENGPEEVIRKATDLALSREYMSGGEQNRDAIMSRFDVDTSVKHFEEMLMKVVTA